MRQEHKAEIFISPLSVLTFHTLVSCGTKFQAPQGNRAGRKNVDCTMKLPEISSPVVGAWCT